QKEAVLKIDAPRSKRKNRKRIKPKKEKKSLLSINYLIGSPYFKEELSPSDDRFVNYGEGYLSQGISFSYSRYL
ncbi:MAG: hypothetical protein P1U56_12110, partial [Saprospiraceae bacterium]|nr:hypothetical protein [Saprospiraceae bacterium]